MLHPVASIQCLMTLVDPNAQARTMSGGGRLSGECSVTPLSRREGSELGSAAGAAAAAAAAETAEASRPLMLMVQSLAQRLLQLEEQQQQQLQRLERAVSELTAGLTAESAKSALMAQQASVSEWHLSQAMKRVDELERGVGERLGAAEVLLGQVAARATAAVTGATQALKATRTME